MLRKFTLLVIYNFREFINSASEFLIDINMHSNSSNDLFLQSEKTSGKHSLLHSTTGLTETHWLLTEISIWWWTSRYNFYSIQFYFCPCTFYILCILQVISITKCESVHYKVNHRSSITKCESVHIWPRGSRREDSNVKCWQMTDAKSSYGLWPGDKSGRVKQVL
jgi:hypothetical protein